MYICGFLDEELFLCFIIRTKMLLLHEQIIGRWMTQPFLSVCLCTILEL